MKTFWNRLLFRIVSLIALTMNLDKVQEAMAADFVISNEVKFRKVVAAEARLEKLASGMQFTEGPVWIPSDGGYLVFSDIPADELKKWSPTAGLTTFRKPSRNANGNTLDYQNRLISCEHSGRRVSRLEPGGELVSLVSEFDGKKFNSPNDAAVHSDGSIWFTDPDYGLRGQPKEYGGCFVFRLASPSGSLTVVAKDFDKPNGICFSPDQTRLYVADSGKPRHIRAFDVTKQGSVVNDRIFCVIDQGVPDGIRCDAQGHLWSSAGDGVQIFCGEGKLVGKILTPESPANLCFGGPDGKTLFITARKSLYSIPVKVKGAR